MKIFKLYILIILLAFSIPSQGQVPDTTGKSSLDSFQLNEFDRMSSDISAIIDILEIQNQSIENINQLISLLNIKHENSITKIHSILKSLSIETGSLPKLKNEKLTAHELLNTDTYFSLEKARLTPLKVFKLDLSKNALTHVPNEIKQFKNLQKLILSDNLLIEIPDWISQLVSLQYIYLSNNRFHEFPISLTKVKSLILIDLSCNPIRYVTTDIKKCSNLEVLNLHDSNINYKQLQRLERTFGEIIIK